MIFIQNLDERDYTEIENLCVNTNNLTGKTQKKHAHVCSTRRQFYCIILIFCLFWSNYRRTLIPPEDQIRHICNSSVFAHIQKLPINFMFIVCSNFYIQETTFFLLYFKQSRKWYLLMHMLEKEEQFSHFLFRSKGNASHPFKNQ